jgi:omega-amidase
MKLALSLAQIDVKSRDPEANLEKGEALVAEAARRGSQLVCFPEMWTTGFDWEYLKKNVKQHQEYVGRIGSLAKKYAIWINGTTPLPCGEEKVANTSILFNDQGEEAARYRKVHLFSYVHENRHLAPGDHLAAVETPWGLTGLSICYDIRFPELFRSYALKGVRLILSPMAFPNPRLEHWKILVRARAIENQLFMAGINQVGTEDFKEHGTSTYFGSSVIIDPWGKTVIEGSETDEMLLTATIDLENADKIRKMMNVLGDRRPDVYEL